MHVPIIHVGQLGLKSNVQSCAFLSRRILAVDLDLVRLVNWPRAVEIERRWCFHTLRWCHRSICWIAVLCFANPPVMRLKKMFQDHFYKHIIFKYKAKLKHKTAVITIVWSHIIRITQQFLRNLYKTNLTHTYKCIVIKFAN